MRTHGLVEMAALIACLSIPTAVNADEARGRSFYIGMFSGYHLISEDTRLGDAADPQDVPNDAPVAGLRLGLDLFPFASNSLGGWVTLEAEGRATFSYAELGADEDGVWAPLYAYRGQLMFSILNQTSVQPFVVAGFGGQSLRTNADFLRSPAHEAAGHWGGGIRVVTGSCCSFRVDYRNVFERGRDQDYAKHHEIHLGFGYHFGWSPPKKKAAKKKTAPPEGPKDLDGDGLTTTDQCPEEPEDRDSFQDNDGCPDTDNDQDGFEDAKDTCPNDPESVNGVDDDDGCPEVDPDGDLIFGSNDQCPNDPEDKDDFEDENGCPDSDNDNDGFDDSVDQCPNDPETVNNFDDDDGCPDEIPKEIKRFTGTIKGIVFQTGKSKIRRSSFKVLDEAVALLKKYPKLVVEIQGHTDSVGSDKKNMTLSQDRADAVRDYLVAKGISAARLTGKGYGETQSIADNKTRAGRAQNRRVDFVWR